MLPEEGEHLTTGREDDLDPADSIERQAVLAHVSWARALTSAARGHFAEGPGWCAGSGGGTSALRNWAIVTSPPRDWAATVRRDLGGVSVGVSALVVSPFPSPDLTAHGCGLVGHPAAHAPSRLDRHLAADDDARRARGDDARRSCRTPSGCSWRAIRCPTWPTSPPGDFYRTDVVAGPTRVFVGYDDGVPVATSAAHSAAGVTVVENVAVLASARGKGAGAAVTWAATTSWPGQGAVLIASDDGQPVYERLGYLRIVRWTCWLRP